MIKKIFFVLSLALLVGAFAFGINSAKADHSWGGYHWARTANPFTLKLGDNVSGAWNTVLATASNDWSQSAVLDTTVVAGIANPKTCKPTLGRIEVCNSKYGNNGWLGIAQVWVTEGTHITQGTTKLNDTYFSTARYNTTAWRNLVACQEIGHTFGLGHQDENFDNANLGTCMDYASDPTTNQHPNQHDYDELALIYSHLDSITTIGQTAASTNADSTENPSDWGRAVAKDASGKDSIFVRDLGEGKKMLTHVFWSEDRERKEAH